MGRIVLAIIVGYMARVVWIQATYSLAQGAMGDAMSSSWMVVNAALSFVGAYIGGSLAMRIGREGGAGAVRGLAVLILIIGLGAAVAQVMGDVADQVWRPWYSFLIPFIGAGGVMLGGRRRPSEK